MKKWSMWFGGLFSAALIGVYLYIVCTGRTEPIMRIVQNLGIWGILIAIALLAIFCILPVPSEFLIIWNMEVFGVVEGTFYSWIGGTIGAWLAMNASKWLARPLIMRLTGRYLASVERWIEANQAVGLLTLRFIPFVPYHAVNYVVGVLQVRMWTFIWTTALGILPFDIAAAGIFSGLRQGMMVWLTIGLSVLVLLSLFSMMLKRRWLLLKE